MAGVAFGIRNQDDRNSSIYKGTSPDKLERAPPRDHNTGFFLPYPDGSGKEHLNNKIAEMNREIASKRGGNGGMGYGVGPTYGIRST